MEFAAPGGRTLSANLPGAASAYQLSGLTGAMSLGRALPGRRWGAMPSISAHLYTPSADPTRFEMLMGLQPRPEPPAPSERTIRSIADELVTQTLDVVKQARENGIALFKQATVERRDPRTGRYPNCRACGDLLFQAVGELKMVRDLDEASHEPLLLLTHLCLEQERPMLASVYLLEAYERHPDLFSGDPAAMHAYFGDLDEDDGTSAVLEAQLRRYVQIGSLNQNSPNARLLEAYCAWRLGDRARAVDAARAAIEILRSQPDVEADRLAVALNFASSVEAAWAP
jgi:hypothetical protein